jgi:hypothetical protein
MSVDWYKYLCSCVCWHIYVHLSGLPGFFRLDGEWIRCLCSWCWHGRSKFTSGKIVQLRYMQYVPTMNKNLVSDSLVWRDGFKFLLELNKVVVNFQVDNLLVKAINAEACSIFPFLPFAITMWTIFMDILVMIQVFFTLVYVTLIFV